MKNHTLILCTATSCNNSRAYLCILKGFSVFLFSFIVNISKLHKEMNYLQCTLSDRSKSVLFKFSRNFTSWSRSWVIFISLSLLDLDFQSFSFHFHFSKRVKGTKISPFFSRKKEWNFTPSFMKNLTILVSRVKNPKQIMSGIMNGDTQLFIQDTTTNNSRFRFLLPILKVLHKKIKCFWGLCPVGKSDKH